MDIGVAMFVAMVFLFTMTSPARAEAVRVAVAANFTSAAEEIGARFQESTGDRAILSFGSTGQLYAQIAQGAPFDAFLAADQKRPERAITDGLAVAGSRFTYATGRIVLFSANGSLVTGEEVLKQPHFTKIAIANPATAPYGAAAVAAMKALGVYDRMAGRIVQGNNIAQTFQFVETGNAEIGFVALSQVVRHSRGSRWIVPQQLYPVIAQDAVLLVRGRDNPAARGFLAFLRGPAANAVKTKYGYGTGN